MVDFPNLDEGPPKKRKTILQVVINGQVEKSSPRNLTLKPLTSFEQGELPDNNMPVIEAEE